MDISISLYPEITGGEAEAMVCLTMGADFSIMSTILDADTVSGGGNSDTGSVTSFSYSSSMLTAAAGKEVDVSSFDFLFLP